MALKLPLRISFPISLGPNPNPTHAHPLPSSELRFSHYDNPNAHANRRRSPNRHEFRRTNNPNADEPSSSSHNGVDPHPAFRFSNIPKSRPKPLRTPPENIKIADDGISFVIEGAPFEFKYSYTETPKAKPLKIREPPYVPFGPSTMPRPWTGRAPLPPSKKKLKEFDSFVLPPPHKKGIKPVQSPGPFLPGTSPRYVHSREEILGEPLTREEITDLVRSSIKTSRQLNIGRDGLTHNMLDNIHAHWKRRRVCKIKCKGVCTVDMDNVCQQLEEKTGGKVIHKNGGVMYLFRGRNYNYKTRPRFPLMLWKPVPPVYPRLVRQVPEGLTLEQATEMRQKGKQLIPICKLAKNGVYCGLAKNVREAFEECELVRINCQGLNKSDYRKIGAKLRDLVPCTLLSFEEEHILMWRGPNWKSSLPNLGDDCNGANNENDKTLPSEVSAPCVQENSAEHVSNLSHDTSISSSSSDLTLEKVEVPSPPENIKQSTTVVTSAASLTTTYEAETINNVTVSYGEPEHCVSTSPSMDISDLDIHAKCPSEASSDSHGNEDTMDCESCSDGLSASISGSEEMLAASDNHINGKVDPHVDNFLDGSEAEDVNQPSMLDAPCMKGVLSLLEQAVEKGSALVLDEDSWDADKIFQTTVAFAKSAPPGPVFTKHKKVVVQKSDKQEGEKSSKTATVMDKKETAIASMKGKENSYKAPRKKEKFDERFLNVAPQGTLGVDELAKLLT